MSHNKFNQYNVNEKGQILNNSPTITNTKLAGQITGNPNLTDGKNAHLIINEVTGYSPTKLLGYTEVAIKPGNPYIEGGALVAAIIIQAILWANPVDQPNKTVTNNATNDSSQNQTGTSSEKKDDVSANQGSASTGGGAPPPDNNNDDGDKKEDLSLLDQKADKHILEGDGDNKGGGHRFGTGKSGKSEFPESWSDQKIKNTVSDIVTDPQTVWEPPSGNGYSGTTVSKGGLNIRVIYDTIKGRVVTAYPTNTPKNP